MEAVGEGHDRLVSAKELANHLGVGDRTIRRKIASGELEATKVGRNYEIRYSDALRVFPRAAQRSEGDKQLQQLQDRAYAELEGRYKELKELFASAQAELAMERRRNARLEVELERQAA